MGTRRRGVTAPLAMAGAALALLLTLAACTTAIAPQPEAEQRAHALDQSLICPICPGETIDRSQVQLAKQMQAIVREQVAAGRGDAEIRQFFVDRYGERVLASPPREGFHLLVWLLPPVGVAAGLFALFKVTQAMARRPTPALEGDGGGSVDDGDDDDDLTPYLEQVERELAGDDGAHDGDGGGTDGGGATDGGGDDVDGDGAGGQDGDAADGEDSDGDAMHGQDGSADSGEHGGATERERP